MDFLVREKNIFGPKGVAAVFDGKLVEFSGAVELSNISCATGRSTLWVPGDSPGKGFDYAFNEGQARGRVLRPDRAIPNNAKVTVSR